MTIDPIALARFMVLKGAAELVDAFSAIPEGYLRESIVSHAQAIAFTYDEARQNGAPIPDPLELAVRTVAPRNGFAPLALPPGPQEGYPKINGEDTPRRRGPGVKTQTPATTAVKLRMQGKAPPEIATELNMDLADVTDALKEARKAGVKFKALPKPPPGARKKTAGWNTDWAAMPTNARSKVEGAALALGLDPQRYLSLKAMLLTMKQAGAHWPEIVKACRPVPEEILWRWVYQARAAGFNIGAKYEEAKAEALVEPPPPRYFPPLDELVGSDRAAVSRAANKRGISSEVYNERRERILQLRMNGVSPSKIEVELGETGTAVKDIIAHAVHRFGLTFPPIVRDA
jgi:hypothetical protein